MPSSFDIYDGEDAVKNLKGFQKLWYHCKEQPLVPIGIIATCFALSKSALSIRSGNHKSANRYFTARVAFQAFTLIALVGGTYMAAKDSKSRDQILQEKAERRKKLWLEDLERQGVLEQQLLDERKSK
ncbi:hypoxia induced protein conserved region-domain-containing protein [Lipomyces japonicus]|uniref:hypoxia induced protein conserved region-domain-containing protein n=1 Tax=Lipomyces japonicus TaxID=56871 RepID=UPI0034CEDBE5